MQYLAYTTRILFISHMKSRIGALPARDARGTKIVLFGLQLGVQKKIKYANTASLLIFVIHISMNQGSKLDKLTCKS